MNRSKIHHAIKNFLSRLPLSSTDQAILKNLLVVTPLSLIGRGGTLLIYAGLANWYGLNPGMDFLYYYWGIAIFLIQILSSSSAYSVLIPLLAEERAKSHADVVICLRAIFSVYLIGIPSICCTFFFACYFVSAFFLPQPGVPRGVAIAMVCGIAIFAVVGSIRWLLKAVLDAYQRFTLPVIIQGLSVPLVIGLIFALQQPFDIASIVVALIIGELLQVITLFIMCHFSLKISGLLSLTEIRYHWRKYAKTGQFLRQSFWMMGASIAAGVNPVVDRGMASSLASGSVSKLDYALKLCAIPENVTGVIFPVLLSHWSSISADANVQLLRQSVWKGILAIVAVMGPLIGGLYYFRVAIVTLVYGHGAMSEPERLHVASLVGIYLVGVFLQLIGRLLIRAHFALQNFTFVFSATLLRAVLNPFLNLIFVKFWGLEGIALATTLLSLPSLVYIAIGFWIVCRRKELQRNE